MFKIEDYQITENVYESKSSLILRGVRKRDEVSVILKVLNLEFPTYSEIDVFKHQYHVMSSLQHLPTIPRIYELQRYPCGWTIVTDDIGGTSLKSLLKQGPLTLEAFFSIGIVIAATVEGIHKNGFIHKDINPNNIIVNPLTQSVQLIDFEISSPILAENRIENDINFLEGTLLYLSPEQTGRVNRGVDERSDLYSLGITCYEMLTGAVPFHSDDPLEVIYQHIVKQPQAPHELNNKIPEEVSSIILKLLAKAPENRYQTAEGLKLDLQYCEESLRERGTIRSFQIAKHDVSSRFKIPQKVYGRKKEITLLQNSFNNVCLGCMEVVVIYGIPGIGKTTLVQELYKYISAKHGYFIQGKFDPLQKGVLCSPIKQIIQDFAKQILIESPKKKNEWRDHLKKVLGDNAKIVLDLAPDLKKIIGTPPELVLLDAKAAEIRFLYVVKNFIQSIATEEHPLVIFWDDVQWIDNLGINLLEAILLEATVGHTLFIFSGHANEINNAHPFSLLVQRLSTEVPVKSIKLKPLRLKQVKELIADTLYTTESEVSEFAAICYARTNGNPIYINQFLRVIYDKKSLYFDKNNSKWAWNLDEIRRQGISENVMELILDFFQEMDEKLKHTLSMASCIGGVFDIQTLAYLLEEEEVNTAQKLNLLNRYNFVMPININYRYAHETNNSGAIYQFSHDKIREMAYNSLLEPVRNEIHLKIGLFLKSKSKDNDNIISIVNHLNFGLHLITNEDELYELANLNLNAAKIAKSSQAYDISLNYLEAGISLLNANCWNDHYVLCLSLYNEAAEVSSFLNEYKKMRFFIRCISKNYRDDLDLLTAYRTIIFSKVSQAQSLQAIKYGLMFLKKLGLNLELNPQKYHVVSAIITMKIMGYKINWIRKKRLSRKTRSMMQILVDIIASCIEVKPELAVIIMCELFVMNARHKNSEFTGFSYICYALVAAGVLGDYERGYQFSELALNAMRQSTKHLYDAKIILLYYYFIHHLKHFFNDQIDLLSEGYRRGLEAGDLEYAGYCLTFYNGIEYVTGVNVNDLSVRSSRVTASLFQGKKKFRYIYHMIHTQTTINLRSETYTHIDILSDANYYDETLHLPELHKKKDILGLGMTYRDKIMLSYLFGQYDKALGYINTIKPIQHLLLSCIELPFIIFFTLLTYIALYPQKNRKEKVLLRIKIMLNLRQLKKFAKFAPMNYLNKYYLVKAELARIAGSFQTASDLYEKAIEVANKSHLCHEEALAKELAGMFYLSWKKDKIGKLYLLNAYSDYSEWGAKAKLKQMEDTYPWLEKIAKEQGSMDQLMYILTTKSKLKANSFDYHSIIKASAILGSEIVLSRLISKILEILSTNLGAERCVFLYQSVDDLVIEGEFKVMEGIVSLLQSKPITQESLLPLTLVQYVWSNQESIILDADNLDKRFKFDHYLAHYAPQSILCFPVISQSKCYGLLYFENNQATEVFTTRSVEFLTILSPQMIIAVENARLYQSFERFVPKQFIHLLGKDDISRVRLGDSVQKNISILFSDICDFTSLTEKENVSSVFALLNDYLGCVEPIITHHHGFIDKFIGDAVMALFPGHADDAVLAALEMQVAMIQFNEKYHRTLSFGIGINTGLCMLGTLGSVNRMDGSVISDSVNIASRIEALTRIMGGNLLITEDTKNKLTKEYSLRFVNKILLKGRSSETIVWEVMDALPEKVRQKRLANLEKYQMAIEFLRQGDYLTAKEALLECLKNDPDDKLLMIHLNQCER